MTGSEGTLEQALRILRRRKLIFLLALIMVPAIALALSLIQDKEYTATATLLFRQSPIGLLAESGSSSTFVDPAREAATTNELIALPVVAAQAAKELGGGVTGRDVLAAVTVEPGGDADVATVSATAASPGLAAQIADAYATAYIKFRREADQSQLQAAIDLINEGLQQLSSSEVAGTQGQNLRDQLDRLELAKALQTGQAELVQPAGIPSSPSAPKTLRNLILGVLLGGMLGIGLIALLERIDRRIRTVAELEELYSLPILARIPRSRSLSGRFLGRRNLTQAPETEAFRTLRVNLSYFNVDRSSQVILIASPEPGDGKSTVARHLAMTMAEMGDNVVLVEADLHKGQPVRGSSSDPGLSSVLAGAMSLDASMVEVETASQESSSTRLLTVLPSGSAPPNPSELLESVRMRMLIADLRESYDIVVIDTPALGAVSDALAIVPEATGILIVSGIGTTTRDGARNSIKQLSILGVTPVGVAANFTDVERGSYSYYRRSVTAKA